jgi:hypothetical protein
MKLTPIIKGFISYIPGLLPFLKSKIGNRKYGGTDSARYCYSIWMRHLICLYKNYGKKSIRCVAEIGPGDSLGMGLMALITGAEKYYAFEVRKFINPQKNLQVFDELILLFKSKEAIPGDNEFPLIHPKLSNYNFPEELFKDNYKQLINENRLNKIRQAIEKENFEEIEIKYVIPWNENYITLNGKIDFLFSQAVMEHINDLEKAYKIMFDVLVPGGMISNEIDYSSHETHEKWNGHLNYGNILWKIIMHGRPYDINRMPHSVHIECLKKQNFMLIKELITFQEKTLLKIKNKNVKQYFKENDYNIQNALIQSIKPNY